MKKIEKGRPWREAYARYEELSKKVPKELDSVVLYPNHDGWRIRTSKA
jgi:hypothetical protein